MLKLSSFIRRVGVKNTCRFFSNVSEVEKQLKNRVQNEIREETEKTGSDKEGNLDLENYSFLKTNGWRLQRSLDSTQMKLFKQIEGKNITVSFNARMPECNS